MPPDRSCTVTEAMLHDMAARAPLPRAPDLVAARQPDRRTRPVHPEAITVATRAPQKPGGTETVPSPPGQEAARP